MKHKKAIVNAVLSAGSTDTPFNYVCNVTQQLCTATCKSVVPAFIPTFTLKGFAPMGNSQYVATVHVTGVVSYVECGKSSCCTRQQLISEDFSLYIKSEAEPSSIELTQGKTVNAVSQEGCKKCTDIFVSETQLSVNVV